MNVISIIIPTLNEAKTLSLTLSHTHKVANHTELMEFIVVDAGSKDRTLETINDKHVISFYKPDFILQKHKSLNYGASKASGEILLFLDADTFLPKNFDELIKSKLDNRKVIGGAFEFSFTETDWKLYLLSIINRIRYRFGKMYYGDQALWVRKEVFDKIGGFPDRPLMETAYLCKELKKQGKLSLIKEPIKTSPRRFNKYGFFTVTWFDINMFIRFKLGLSVSEYAKKYWSKNLTNE